MRRFGTQGPVHPEKNYVVSRAAELADFVMCVKEGRYIVIFAPRQTGKTTFFQRALDVFADEEPTYFPIPLNFEVYEDCEPPVFFTGLYEDLLEAIENVFTRRGEVFSEALTEFLENAEITDHLSMGRFFRNFSKFLGDQRVILITHNQRKYIIETKIWRGDSRYQAGKKQLVAYLKLESTTEGYYIVFDHRQDPEPRVETETIDDVTIRSYVIPVLQEPPSSEGV